MNTTKVKEFMIYDSKAEVYKLPFFAPTTAVGLRLFEQAVSDPNTDLHRFAGDFTLFEMGEIDLTNGNTTMHAAPVNLGTALQFVARAEQFPRAVNDNTSEGEV